MRLHCMACLFISCLFVTAVALSEARTFLSQHHASQFLVRKRRANSFVEERMKGNLERECIEELCNKEEAREIFENNPETDYFYPKYLTCLASFRTGIVRVPSVTADSPADLRSYINECEDPTKKKGGCGQACINVPGSYRCHCQDGYYMLPNKLDCEDIDECAENACSQMCVNSPGSYTCYCDGKKGFKLSTDMRTCEPVQECITLNLEKNYELLYLAEQFIGMPVLYLRFRLPEITRFSAEFDFRTYDKEGIILYAESPDSTAWFLLAVRDGKIEIQFKNELGSKVTSGGKAVNDGLWHMISVEELDHSISVKIAKEAVMNINSPRNLFKPSNGFLETKVYIAGLPRKMDNTLIKSINPRLDGCIRAWNLLNQGNSGVKDIIQQKQSKHCLLSVEKGSYYPGTGEAKFHINYNNSFTNTEDWLMNVTLAIRPSTGTGVMFALVSGDTVPLALSLVDFNSSNSKEIIVSIENIIVARVESPSLCTPAKVLLELRVTKNLLELMVDSQSKVTALEHQLFALHQAMNGSVDTYLGGIPDIPIGATPITAFYNGCMEVIINDKQLDLDEAVSKKNDIRSHSCPMVMEEMQAFETSDFHSVN
ncbi:hypothetical protein lerEdw1_011373 [Lerista edwardsae]|nr:hypothetical protein lerEdw1_011373 [Lerista edwardsae]